MSNKLPSIRPDRVVRALKRAGFAVVRQTGSHAILQHPDGRFANVPIHGSQDVPPGTLRGILATAGMTADELRELL